MTTIPEPVDESVHAAVAREAQRRKRVLALYLALLIVPVAIGAYALAVAPKESEVVADKVTPLVQERVDRQFSETVVAKAEPIIATKVSQEVSEKVAPLQQRVTKFDQDVRGLQSSVSAVQSTVTADGATLRSLTPQVQQIPALQQEVVNATAMVRETSGALGRLENDLKSNQESISALGSRITEQDSQIRGVLGRVNSELGEVRRLTARVNASDDQLKQLSNRIDEISNWRRSQDEKLLSLERRIKAIETRLDQPTIR